MKLSGNSVINIKPISITESSIVLDLWKGSANWLKKNAIDQWDPDTFHIKDIIDYINKGSEVLLARVDKEIVGTLIICWSDPEIWEELDTVEAAYIHKFAVNREYKGYGVGSAILSRVEEYLRDKGKRIIRLDCMTNNLKLNQYYQSMRFRFIRSKTAWNINLYEREICE